MSSLSTGGVACCVPLMLCGMSEALHVENACLLRMPTVGRVCMMLRQRTGFCTFMKWVCGSAKSARESERATKLTAKLSSAGQCTDEQYTMITLWTACSDQMPGETNPCGCVSLMEGHCHIRPVSHLAGCLQQADSLKPATGRLSETCKFPEEVECLTAIGT